MNVNNIVICDSCASKNVTCLGGVHYFRKENGDYLRKLGYQCKDCKETFLS